MSPGSRPVAALLATLLVAGPALADPKPSDKDAHAAGELVKKAIAKSQAGDHEAAIAIYQQAYGIVPSSALLSNIGTEYQQSGKLKDALKYFCMYLDKDPEGANAPYATLQARQLQKQLGNKLGEGDDVCAPPKVEPRPRPVEEPPVVATRPPEPEPVEPPAPRDHGSATMRITGLVAGLVGLGAVGVGIYEGVQAKNISDEISAHMVPDRWPGDIRELEARGQRHENLEIGFLIGGGVAITAGVVLFALGRSSAAPDRERTAIRVAPTRNGFAVLGRF
jgi:hypothetical protein